MSGSEVLLTEENRAPLLKVSDLLEEIIETFDTLEDEEGMRSIREAKEDMEAGRVRDYNEFIEELRSGEI